MALLAHAAALYVLVRAPSEALLGAGGAELEAISVDVVVSAAPASASSMTEAAAGSLDAANTDSAKADQRPAAVEPKPEAAVVAERQPETGHPDAPVAEENHELAALALLVARQRHEDSDRAAAAKPSTEAKTEAASAGARAGARGVNAAELPEQDTAAVGANRARQYARTVVQTLAQSKPKHRAGARGTVRIAFTIAPTGVVAAAVVRKSSGAAVIDEAALEAVRVARFPAPPGGLTTAQLMFEIPYIFR